LLGYLNLENSDNSEKADDEGSNGGDISGIATTKT
jgi:hypothetical protein